MNEEFHECSNDVYNFCMKYASHFPLHYVSGPEGWGGYYFYKTEEAFKNETGKKLIKHPLGDCLVNIRFLQANKIYTSTDLAKWLNKYGYSKATEKYVAMLKIKFSKADWRWIALTNFPLLGMIKKVASPSILFPGAGKILDYQLYDLNPGGKGHAYIAKFKGIPEEQSAPKVENWLVSQMKWNFKPDSSQMKFIKDPRKATTMFYGMEIEVSSKLSYTDLQRVVTEVEPQQEPFFYFKYDSSIKGKYPTYEIVTFPSSKRMLKFNMRLLFEKLDKLKPDWRKFFDVNESQGIHIHMSTQGFNDNFHTSRFVVFWNQYEGKGKNFIQKIGHRKYTQHFKAAATHEGLTLSRRLQTSTMESMGCDKYSCCRETGQTLEVRVFKASLDLDFILYCIDTVTAVADYTEKVPIRNLSSVNLEPGFLAWLQGTSTYNYAKRRLTECA